MISNRATATILFDAAYSAYNGVYTALERISDNLPPEEITAVKEAVGKVMGEILMELTEPILERHPELLPEDWTDLEDI